MLKSNLIVISCKNHKPEKFDLISKFVRFAVRQTEYEKNVNSSDYKDLREKFETACADVDVLTCEESLINEKLTPVDAEKLIAYRNEIISLKTEIATIGVTLDEYNALGSTDKVFITLQAHTAMKSIKLSTDILEKIDIATPVKKFYSQGTLKGIKDILRTLFSKVVGEEGELFYGVKLKKSDFSDENIRNCLAYFRGDAKRSVSKKDGGEIVGAYDWTKKEDSVQAQIMAITNLFAVTLDKSNDYEVVKPEAPAEESQEKTPVKRVGGITKVKKQEDIKQAEAEKQEKSVEESAQ